jgi:O-antigen ligase
MRRYIIFFVALFAFSGGLSAVFATQSARDNNLRGYVDATQEPNLPYRLPRLGVNADLMQYDEAELRQNLDWMQQAHINWVRQFAYWDALEPVQDQFDWQAWDIVTSALANYPDLHLVVVFMNSPAWSRSSDIQTAPPDDPNSIRPFLTAFAERYGEQVDFYQIWDEPNLDDAWGLSQPRPADYAALLAEAYQVLHGADGDATVIAAALAPTTERGGYNIADILYLEELYAIGANQYFDAAAAKPYGFDFSPDDRRVSIDMLNFSRIIALHEVMLAHGDSHKTLWASNWGWNSLPDNWTGLPSIWGSVTEQERLDYTINALDRAEREWPWLGGIILHHWQPDAAQDDPMWGFSVIDRENQATRLWETLVNRPMTSSASNGLYHPRTEYARYSGLWTFSELGADIGWLETTDSQLDFDFYGTDIALLLREGDYFAFLYLTIDGQQANATPHDASGNAYILLRSATLQAEMNLVPVSRDLPLDNHTLHIIPDKGWDRWAFAAYAVSSGNLAAPYNQQIVIAWISSFFAALATLISGYLLPWVDIRRVTSGFLARLNDTSQIVISMITSLALMVGMLLTWGIPDAGIFRRDMSESLLLIILTGGLIVLKPGLIIVLIASVLLLWLIYHRLEWGLLLILLYAPFFLFPVELYRFAFPMSELLLLITGAAWILRLLVQWGYERQSANSDYPLRITIQWTTIDTLMLIWFVLACIALLWSERLSPAITELRTLFFEPLLFYFIFRTIEVNHETLRRLVNTVIITGVLVAVIGLLLYLRGEAIITAESGVRRLASVYGSPNNVGLFLGRCIPFAFAILLNTKRVGQRIIFGIALFMMLIALALTQSVGALLIGIPVGIFAVLILTYRMRAILFVLGLLLIGIVSTVFLTHTSPRFVSLLDMSSGTNFIRLRVWESTIEILKDKPLTGLGLDQFLYEFRGQYVRPDAIYDPDLSHPHNIILDFWVRLGLAGFIWLLIFMTKFWRDASQVWKAHQNSPVCDILIGAIAVMAGVIAHGLIDNSLYVNDLIYLFMFVIGLLVHIRAMSNHDELANAD